MAVTLVVPQVNIFQEFSLIPAPVVQPLRAFIFGPDFAVRSYPTSKAYISLGAYNDAANTPYAWPSIQPGDVVDPSYTEVWFENAWINYFNYNGMSAAVSSVAPNVLRLASGGWTAVPGFARSGLVPRDVAPGDGVIITDPSNAAHTLTALVKGFAQTPIASSHDASSTAGSANAASQSSSHSYTGPGGSPFTPTVGVGSYKPFIKGILNDVYTLKITTAGLSGAAVASISSASGLDPLLTGIVITTGSPVALGALGATVTFADSGASTYNLGDTWVFTVACTFAAPAGSTVVIGGTYTGPTSPDYILTIVTGGVVGTDSPTFKVTTSDGSDAGGPYAATVAPVGIGSQGLTVHFTNAEDLKGGDVFFFQATAASLGATRDILLTQSLPSNLVLADVIVSISAIRTQEILQPQYLAPSILNWAQTAALITLNAGILSYTTAETGLNGYPIIAGTAYASYRALSQKNASGITSISSTAALKTAFAGTPGGGITPDNVLAYGVQKALENANGTVVNFMAVPTNDLNGYNYVLGKTLSRNDVYSFCPLTKDAGVLAAVQGHIDSESTPEKGFFRIGWFTPKINSVIPVVANPMGVPFTATVLHNPADLSGTYKLVTSATATFITSGVLAGDTFRYAYGTDAIGNVVYATDTVSNVISETQLELFTGPATPVVVASKFEIWRALTASQIAANLVTENTFADRRIYNVIGGNQNEADGFVNVDDMFVAAAYAGIRGGVAPHQGLTNVALAGFTAVPWTTNVLMDTDLDTLMNGGYWVVQQGPNGGAVYCRFAISTDLTDLNSAIQMRTTNTDAISYYFLSILRPYLGNTNVTPSNANQIMAQLTAAIAYLQNTTTTPTLGPQLLNGSQVVSIQPNVLLPNRYTVQTSLVEPWELDGIDNYLVIG
jgi:hypothetical protein